LEEKVEKLRDWPRLAREMLHLEGGGQGARLRCRRTGSKKYSNKKRQWRNLSSRPETKLKGIVNPIFEEWRYRNNGTRDFN